MFHSKGVWCSIQRGCGVSFKGVVIIQRSGGHSKGVLLAGDVSRGGDVSFNRCDVLVGVGVGWAAAAILCKLHMQSYLSKSITY